MKVYNAIDIPETRVISDKEPTLKEMQDFVGGYIQVVTSVNGNEDIVINEEGKLNGLPINVVATTMWLGEDWNDDTSAMANDVLVGNAMILKGKARLS
jgi:hypothetical protein